MAMGILGAYSGLLKRELPDHVFVGGLMLDGSAEIQSKHIAEVIQHRTLDRSYWA